MSKNVFGESQSRSSFNPFAKNTSGFFYQGGQRNQILEILPHLGHYQHYLVFVTGLECSGKTYLKEQIERSSESSHHHTISIPSESLNLLTETEFIRLLADSLDVTYSGLPSQLMNHLLASIHSITERGHQVVFLIDDADYLTESAMMYIFKFLLANENRAVQFILFSQPDMVETCEKRAWGSYFEEYGHHISLPNLNYEETEEYLRLRLTHFGYAHIDFPNQLIGQIYEKSDGVIGIIDELAFSVFDELKQQQSKKAVKVPRWHILSAAVVALAVLVLVLSNSAPDAPNERQTLTTALVLEDGVLEAGVSEEEGLGEVPPVNKKPLDEKLAGDGFNKKSPNEVEISFNWKGKQIQDSDLPKQAPDAKTVLVPQVGFSNTVSQPEASSSKPVATLDGDIASKAGVPQTGVPQGGSTQTQPSQAPAQVNKQRLVSTQVQSVKKPDVTSGVAYNETRSPEVKPSQVKQKISTREEWVMALNAKRFTLQLMGGRDEKAIQNFIRLHQELKDLGYYKTEHRGEAWFVVIKGEYPTRQHAQAAISGLPSQLQKRKPWARKIGDVQSSLR